MLSESDTSITEVLSVFASYELEVCLVVPTETAMNKSIIDATHSVRTYFETNDIHNYSNQPQGPEHKVTKSAYFVFDDHIEETKISLYRPNTKTGDPRIWFYGLREYASPYNLIAILYVNDTIYVINCSDKVLLTKSNLKITPIESIATPATPLGKIADQSKPRDTVSMELLDKLKEISLLGYIPTDVPGDTGIGITLQNLLGIDPDSSKKPDYKGIELKSKRLGKSETRFTLFSNVPNWELSPILSAWNLLMKYGYEGKGGKWRLSHQMDAIKPNSLGLILELDWENDLLKQNHFDIETAISTHMVTWDMKTLRSRLQEKHNETFWIYANKRGQGPNEEFHYILARHTRSPILSNFDKLLESGLISHDYTLSIKNESTKTVRDHGYLFKIMSDNISALIPQIGEYDLV
jgi:hypothetical protein